MIDELTRIIWNEYIAIPRNKNKQQDKLSPANLKKLIEQWTEKNSLESLESLRGQHSAYYAMEYLDLPDAYSLKAVKRLISKWNAPKGTWFKASLPYVGYEFKIRKS